MNCEQFLKALNGSRLESEARRHAGQCRQCAALLGAMEELSADLSLAPEVEERLKARFATGLTAAQQAPAAWVRTLGFGLVGAVVAIAGIVALGVRGWHAMGVIEAACFSALLAGGALAQSRLLAKAMIPGESSALAGWIPATVVVAGFVAGTIGWMDVESYDRFAAIAGACFAIGAGHALVVEGAARIILRRGYVTDPRRVGVLAGGLGGITGLTVLTVFCPHQDLWHGILGHCTMAAAVAVQGWLRGRRAAV